MKQKAFIFVYYLTAFCLLLIGYYSYITQSFGYAGFEWIPNQMKIVESSILLVLFSFILPRSFKKPSDVLLHLQFLFPIFPMLVLYGASNKPREFFYFTIISFCAIIVLSKINVKAISIAKFSQYSLQYILLILSVSYILSIVAFGGLHYLNFDFSKVYEFRSDAASNLPKIFGYFSPMVSKVMLPFSLLIAVVNKNRLLAAISIGGSVMMFALTNHKSSLFYPFAVLGLYWILHKKNTIEKLLIGYIAVILISLSGVSYGELGNWIGSLFMRRTFFLPAHLNYLFYDFFSSNPLVYWANNSFTFGMVDYNYPYDPKHMIGYIYYSRPDGSGNTGWIGSGYAHAGFCGMLFYACIVGLLFCFLDAYSRIIDQKIIVAILVAPMITMMMSSDLPVSFFTHGILLSLMLLAIQPNTLKGKFFLSKGTL